MIWISKGSNSALFGFKEVFSEFGFEDFARRTNRNGLHKDHVIGDLPLGGFTDIKSQQFLFAKRKTWLFNDHHNRSLVPFGVGNGDIWVKIKR